MQNNLKVGDRVIDRITKYMIISLLANLFLSLIKITFGLVSGMKSLIADGIHSFSDLTTDVIAIIGNKLSRKPADDGHPRGHGKIEYITSLMISIFIVSLGISILRNSFVIDNTIPNIYLVLIVIVTIIVKYFLSFMLIKEGKKINNMILISSGKESYTDVYSSFLVLIIIIISQFYNSFHILIYSDMIGSILISILVIIMGAKLMIKNLSLLIGESEQSILKIKEVEKIIKSRPEKFVLKECTLFKLGSYYEVILKIQVSGNVRVKVGHELMDNIERDLLDSDLNIQYVTIHIEPIKGADNNARATRGRDSKRNIKKKSKRENN